MSIVHEKLFLIGIKSFSEEGGTMRISPRIKLSVLAALKSGAGVVGDSSGVGASLSQGVREMPGEPVRVQIAKRHPLYTFKAGLAETLERRRGRAQCLGWRRNRR